MPAKLSQSLIEHTPASAHQNCTGTQGVCRIPQTGAFDLIPVCILRLGDPILFNLLFHAIQEPRIVPFFQNPLLQSLLVIGLLQFAQLPGTRDLCR